TAERIRLPWCLSSFASKRSNSVKASAVPPAKPARMRSWYRRRIFFAPPLMTTLPRVTWPSPPSAPLAPRRTARIVVPCICSMGSCLAGDSRPETQEYRDPEQSHDADDERPRRQVGEKRHAETRGVAGGAERVARGHAPPRKSARGERGHDERGED